MADHVTIGNYLNRLSAEIDKVLLEENGIISYVRADDGGNTDPFLLTGTGGVWLIVNAEDAETAKQLLKTEPLDENFVEPVEGEE